MAPPETVEETIELALVPFLVRGCVSDHSVNLTVRIASAVAGVLRERGLLSQNVFFPPAIDVTPLGKEYLERRVSCMQQLIDKEEWRHEDGEMSKREYWVGRLHEAKIALNNLTCGMERRGDGFGHKLSQKS